VFSGPGWGCGAPDDQFDGDLALFGGAAFQDGEEGVHASFSEEFGVQSYGREFGVECGGQGDVVHAGDGDVVGDPQSASS
jgi:hypothetical protein